MIRIITDSTAYLPLEAAQEHNIKVLPIKLNIDGKEHFENKIGVTKFYENVTKSHTLPDTLPLDTDYLYEVFEEELKEGNKVIAIFLSPAFSDTYENAKRARESIIKKYTKASITVINSKALCMQQGLAVLAAAEKLQHGAWLEDVIKAAQENINYTRLMVVPEKLKNLEISGKVKKHHAVIGDIISLNAILTIEDGEMQLLDSVHNQARALQKAIDILKEDNEKFGVKKVTVHHIESIDKAISLASQIEDIAGVEVMISEIGPATGMRFGLGTLAFAYETIDALHS